MALVRSLVAIRRLEMLVLYKFGINKKLDYVAIIPNGSFPIPQYVTSR